MMSKFLFDWSFEQMYTTHTVKSIFAKYQSRFVYSNQIFCPFFVIVALVYVIDFVMKFQVLQSFQNSPKKDF